MMSKKKVDFRVRYRTLMRRRRVGLALGFAIVLAGYTLLAISPNTETHWVLLRVSAGFFCIFAGFCIAVVKLFTRPFEGGE
jgi:uncharacterized membrane protein